MGKHGKTLLKRVVVKDQTYTVEIEADREYGGYSAEVAGLPGCITQGDTLKEVRENAKDAIDCWLKAREELSKEGVPVPNVRRRLK